MAESVFSAIVNGPFLGWSPIGVTPWTKEAWTSFKNDPGSYEIGVFPVPAKVCLELSSCRFFAARDALVDGTNLRSLMSEAELLQYCSFSLKSEVGTNLWERSSTKTLNRNLVEGIPVVLPSNSVIQALVRVETLIPSAVWGRSFGVELKGRLVSENIAERLEAIHEELMRRAY